MEQIVRKFRQQRSQGIVEYPFTTYSVIFQNANMGKFLKNTILKPLCDFLVKQFTIESLPEDLGSVSAQPILVATTNQYSDHNVVKLCVEANYEGKGKNQHAIVQNYFLDNDPNTIAIEVPVFDKELLGHIDILRVLPDRIQILDFKPKAHRETKAASQVMRYRRLLRQHIPGVKIEAAYFDNSNIYFLN